MFSAPAQDRECGDRALPPLREKANQVHVVFDDRISSHSRSSDSRSAGAELDASAGQALDRLVPLSGVTETWARETHV
ncbi:MAG: hypothetical protein D6725_07445 [Planctomycetota bacterium]|nr:MAG: hypothetical protein D6725_07445 [Planctomycetota bacterium]